VSDGPSYLVHQPDGTTFGPADVAMLKEWVAAGIVTRTTALSIQGDERRTPAAIVPGLFEPEPVSKSTVKPADPMYHAHLASGTTDALALADLLRMVETGEIVSTTPISLVGGSKKVPAAVVPGLEDALCMRSESVRTETDLTVLEPQPCSKEPVESTEESGAQEPYLEEHLEVGASDDCKSPPGPASPSEFFAGAALFCGISIVLVLVVLGGLTKLQFPSHGMLSSDTTRDVAEGIWGSRAGKQVLAVVALILLPSVTAQSQGWSLWTGLGVPLIWLAINTCVLLTYCRLEKAVFDEIFIAMVCGVGLGIWYGSMLSATWFGPHPLVLRH